MFRCLSGAVLTLLFMVGAQSSARADLPATIARVKSSVMAVGTFQKTRSPPFRFTGTGFAVGDGTLVVTNLHVLPQILDRENGEALVAVTIGADGKPQPRELQRLMADADHDLAVLRQSGPPLPALPLRESAAREGELYAITGFPLGTALGLSAVSNRAMISAISAQVPQAMRADQLTARTIRRLGNGAASLYQLDATIYPGNSGSPLYDGETGEVVGIVSMGLVKGDKESALRHPTGIGYAMPVRHLADLLREAR